MKAKSWAMSLAGFVLIAFAVLAVACPPRGQPVPDERPAPEPTTAEPTAEAQPEEAEPAEGEAEGEVVVEMSADRFQPEEITVRVGETVRWRNTSDLVHTVTADPERAADSENVELPEGAETFHSGDIAPGDEFTREFMQAGTYRYICVPHETMGMMGTVIVEEQEDSE